MIFLYGNSETGTLSLLFVSLLLLLRHGWAQDMSRRRTSNTCRDHQDCPTFAYCEQNMPPLDNGLCVCREGYIIVTNNRTRACLKVADGLNEPCVFDDQCMFKLSTESECQNGTCQCRDGTHYVRRENACYKSVMVGDWCRLTNNCIGENTVCRSGVCRCPPGSHSNANFTGCVQDLNLGDICHSDDQCVTPNSRCHDICRCRVSHVISEDRLKCLKIADQIFSPCAEDSQCQFHIPHAVCGDNYTCVCKDGFHEKNYQCWVTVKAGGLCEADENCSATSGGPCNSGRCDCQDGYRLIDGQCSWGTTIYNSIPLGILLFVAYFIRLLLM